MSAEPEPPTPDQAYHTALCNERVAAAAAFLQVLPPFPPNVEQITMLFHYNDGNRLEIKVSPKP